MSKWMPFGKRTERREKQPKHNDSVSTEDLEAVVKRTIPKWSLGILQDRDTDEVPGSIVLLSQDHKRNEPLGLQHTPARTSSSSLPSPYRGVTQSRARSRSGSGSGSRSRSRSRASAAKEKKKTADGKIVLEPQPDDTRNDPLNWPVWQRNAALLSLGFYCMLGGGMTPILAAGFNEVAATFDIDVTRVPLTTGLYMMGLGVGGVVVSPTAIQFGKRPVYLVSCLLFILSSIWCALSPHFTSLIIARIFQGIAVSPVEVLPSATIAEIFFLHERAYRLGIYTLLLLGGKNLIPLVSAAIIQSLDWRWVFYVVAIVLGFCGILLFFFVPETFWDRTPRARQRNKQHLSFTNLHLPHVLHTTPSRTKTKVQSADGAGDHPLNSASTQLKSSPVSKKALNQHVAFDSLVPPGQDTDKKSRGGLPKLNIPPASGASSQRQSTVGTPLSSWRSPTDWNIVDDAAPVMSNTPDLHNLNSPWYVEKAMDRTDYFALSGSEPGGKEEEEERPPTAAPKRASESEAQSSSDASSPSSQALSHDVSSPVLKLPVNKRKSMTDKQLGISQGSTSQSALEVRTPTSSPPRSDSQNPENEASRGAPIDPVVASRSPVFNEKFETPDDDGGNPSEDPPVPAGMQYTERYRAAPTRSYKDNLKPFHGRFSHDNWFRIALRPFVLFAYPAILWSAMVYALSVGWLIVLSESVSQVYAKRSSYHFTPIQIGLVYISPFVGGILGTAVAGKVSDIVVRFMAKRNDGVYEPEFRLIMAIPIAITSVIGLMGFGWSAAEKDMWFIPTFFFGVISFGCSLGSTTAITFAVDSYRQYAGEALVTLNFSKNIFHGLVFSLFFPSWLEHDGSKIVFIALGAVQLGCLVLTVPMYIYGKRARMWTVRKNLMEKL